MSNSGQKKANWLCIQMFEVSGPEQVIQTLQNHNSSYFTINNKSNKTHSSRNEKFHFDSVAFKISWLPCSSLWLVWLSRGGDLYERSNTNNVWAEYDHDRRMDISEPTLLLVFFKQLQTATMSRTTLCSWWWTPGMFTWPKETTEEWVGFHGAYSANSATKEYMHGDLLGLWKHELMSCFDRSVNRMYDWSPVVVFPISLVSQHVVLSLLPNLFRSAPSARWSSPSALETQVNNKQQDEGPLFDESICYWFLSWRPPLFPPPLQQQCNSVKENVANREGWLRETRGRMSNKRFILPGQRCGNGVGMSVQGQSIDTDRQSKQSPLWVNAASGWQLKDIQPAQEVNTARVRRSGVRVTSPALLFSFRQWNKPVPMPEANHATLGKKIPVLC